MLFSGSMFIYQRVTNIRSIFVCKTAIAPELEPPRCPFWAGRSCGCRGALVEREPSGVPMTKTGILVVECCGKLGF